METPPSQGSFESDAFSSCCCATCVFRGVICASSSSSFTFEEFNGFDVELVLLCRFCRGYCCGMRRNPSASVWTDICVVSEEKDERKTIRTCQKCECFSCHCCLALFFFFWLLPSCSFLCFLVVSLL